MTDVGTLAAMETEIMTALAGLPGVVELKATCSAEDLLFRDGIRMPAVGIVDAGIEWKEGQSVGQKVQIATFRWEVTVLVDSKRGRIDARTTLRELLETIRDRLHWLQTATTLKTRYRWRLERPLDIGRPDVLGTVATYELESLIGN